VQTPPEDGKVRVNWRGIGAKIVDLTRRAFRRLVALFTARK
jgi:hypothetical protein